MLPLAAGVLGALGLLLAGCASSGSSAGTEDIVAQIPLRDGERFVYELIDRDGELVGHGTFTTTANGDTFELRQSYEEPETPPGARPISDDSLVVVDTTTLKPHAAERTIRRREAEDDEAYSAVYDPTAPDGPRVLVTRLEGGEERERDIELRDHYYDTESSLWLWRTIDLREDFEARYVNFNARDGSQATARLVIVDRQTIEVPAGTFETWRLQVRTGRDTRIAWIHVEAPHEIVQWDNGSLFFRLEKSSTGGGG